EFRYESDPRVAETWRFALAKKPGGRRRADVKINVFEQFELRSRSSVEASLLAKQERSIRRAERRAARLAAKNAPVQITITQDALTGTSFVVPAVRTTLTARLKPVRGYLTMLVFSGMMATSALPAYAMSPELAAFAGVGSLDPNLFSANAETQGLTVTQIGLQNYKRGTAKDISAEELLRQQTISAYRDYSGPTAEDFLLNPPFPTYNTEKVMQVAAKYVGVPYVFGGETPAGFDCSGYVKFVFSQFGIALPHSVNGQARMGKIIKPEDALPGDLVIMNDHSHDGIYAGNGMFYHAPLRGDKVKLAPIFTPKHYFVRLGIDG
ncbi:MAG: C40 family peptidase, partial [Micrococcales bacterium]